MTTGVGIILQARFGSRRLPGKALASVGGISILWRCLNRLRRAGAGPVVLATTERAEDDALADIAHRMGLDIYRGSTDDVLGRFVGAALRHRWHTVIRATADNPAVDIDAAARLVAVLTGTGADYACEDGLPCGAGLEAVTTAALLRTASAAVDAEDREHVTTFIKRQTDSFHVERPLAPAHLRRPELRFTVDTAADLTYMRRVFARVRSVEPSLSDMIAAADACVRSKAA